jgi:cell division protease FtsH
LSAPDPSSGRLRRLRALGVRLSSPWRGASRTTRALAAGLVLVVVVLAGALAALRPEAPGSALRFDELLTSAAGGEVTQARLLDQDNRVVGRLADGRRFHATYPANAAATADLLGALAAGGTPLEVDAQTAKATIRLLATTVLPLVLLANLFALFVTAGGSGSSGIAEVTDFSRMERGATDGSGTGFADVAGVDEAIEELSEVVEYLTNPDRFAAMGASPPKGVLLHGPPGCGKTLLARAVAGEARVPFFSVAGAEFVESLVGVGAARVRDLFAQVRRQAPAIVFIDEVDAAGRRRGGGAGGGEERDNTLNQLLVEMDGFEPTAGIVIMAATNRPDILDPALLRPGRFDRHVMIERPDLERREAILRLHAAKRPTSPRVDFAALATRTAGFTGADLANVVNEAALLTIRAVRSQLEPEAFAEAIERVQHGPRRRGHLLSTEERRHVAAHEAGRVLAAELLGRRDPEERASLTARGGAGRRGLTSGDATVTSRARLLDLLTLALAGRSGEALLAGDVSTASDDDLRHATELARRIAGRHGMVPELGLATLVEADGDHLDGTALPAWISDATHAELDHHVEQLLAEASARATELLEAARPQLDQVHTALLERETLEPADLAQLLGAPAPEGRHPAAV